MALRLYDLCGEDRALRFSPYCWRAKMALAPKTAPVHVPADADHFITRDGVTFAGHHLIIDLWEAEGLDDKARIEQAMRDAIEAAGATLLHIHTHKFTPQGVSGVAVLAESHISVHTWPEIGYGAFDVFMCGDADPWRAVEVLRRAFDAGEVRVRELLRGEGLVPEPGA